MSSSVREVAFPPSFRALTTLPRVDYTDAFILTTPAGADRMGVEWARALVEDAPAETRRMLRRGWCALGVRLGSPDDERRVLGWEVRRTSPDHAVLAADSRLGMEAELVFERRPGALLFATIIKLNSPLARIVWTLFSPQHRKVVRHLLAESGRRTAASA